MSSPPSMPDDGQPPLAEVLSNDERFELVPVTAQIDRIRTRGRLLAPLAYASVMLMLVGGMWWIGSRISTPEQRAADAAPPPTQPITVPAEYRPLESVVVLRGDVVIDSPKDIVWSGGEETTSFVTDLPVVPGELITEGNVVLEVSGRPILCISGAFPFYRDLTPATRGRDVAQLQNALDRLGYEITDESGVYGPTTAEAVASWYETTGYQAVTYPADASAALDEAQGALRQAEMTLSEAERSLASSQQGAPTSVILESEAAVKAAERAVASAKAGAEAALEIAQGELNLAVARLNETLANPDATAVEISEAELAVAAAESNVTTVSSETGAQVAAAEDSLQVAKAALSEVTTQPDVEAERIQVETATQQLQAAKEAYDHLAASIGAMVPRDEVVVVDQLPARLGALQVALGDPAKPVLGTFVSGDPLVRSYVDAPARDLILEGAAVVLLDEVSGVKVDGVVASVATSPTSPPSDEAPGFEVIVAPASTLDSDWLGRNVRVTITARATDGSMIVVPEAALFSRGDGRTLVRTYDQDSRVEREVAVEVALVAGGYAAVAAATLEEGTLVVVGSTPSLPAPAQGAP